MPADPDLTVFAFAERCLRAGSVAEKLALTERAAALARDGRLTFHDAGTPLPAGAVRFPERPVQVYPRDLPRRKLTATAGRIALLHAVAHIEFTAIHLAWDLLQRFRGLPEPFYRDWLGVAAEEALHFSMVQERLEQLGSGYGELPAHRGLWEVAVDTADDLVARLALVPRCMEARGLDVTPGMIQKLEAAGDTSSAAVLSRILQDEVGHVALGSRWFRWACERDHLEPEQTFLDLIRRHLKGALRGPFNRELRTVAGFSESELRILETTGG